MRATDTGMVPLGYGRFVRADEIVAVLPIDEGRGRGRPLTGALGFGGRTHADATVRSGRRSVESERSFVGPTLVRLGGDGAIARERCGRAA
jgi:hypothetical protein